MLHIYATHALFKRQSFLSSCTYVYARDTHIICREDHETYVLAPLRGHTRKKDTHLTVRRAEPGRGDLSLIPILYQNWSSPSNWIKFSPGATRARASLDRGDVICIGAIRRKRAARNLIARDKR